MPLTSPENLRPPDIVSLPIFKELDTYWRDPSNQKVYTAKELKPIEDFYMRTATEIASRPEVITIDDFQGSLYDTLREKLTILVEGDLEKTQPDIRAIAVSDRAKTLATRMNSQISNLKLRIRENAVNPDISKSTTSRRMDRLSASKILCYKIAVLTYEMYGSKLQPDFDTFATIEEYNREAGKVNDSLFKGLNIERINAQERMFLLEKFNNIREE
jgi:hypothetical protein